MDTIGSAATRTTAHPFPFPYFGAGDATYDEHVEVFVRFARPPTPDERRAIVDAAPPPLRGQVRWTDGCRQLAVGTHEFALEEIASAYPHGPRDFNVATGAWLRRVHGVCPVRMAFRPPDTLAGGTRLSAWHGWSVNRIGVLATEFGHVAAADDARGDGGVSDAVFVVRGVLDMAREAGEPVSPRLLDWLDPGAEEEEALRTGDTRALVWLVGGLAPGRRPAVAERLSRALRPERSGEVAAFAAAGSRLLRTTEVAPRVVVAVVEGALAACAAGHGRTVAPLLAEVATVAAADRSVAGRLRTLAWELRLAGRRAGAAQVLALLGRPSAPTPGARADAEGMPRRPTTRLLPRPGPARRGRGGRPPRGPVGQMR